MQKNTTIVIITVTFNRSALLNNLYNTLLSQDNKSFRWIIVNDGSKDNTNQLIADFKLNQVIDITFIQKENSGKSSSLNIAFDHIREYELAVIVDDDEELDVNAISKIISYYDKYFNTSVGIIHFNRRMKRTSSIISNYLLKNDLLLNYKEFKAKKYYADGYIAFFGYALKNLRFPIYGSEKYIGPAVMMIQVGREFEMIWAYNSIGCTEYLNDGLTKQGRKLRLKNPLSSLLYCTIVHSNLITRIKYSIMGYAYMFISKTRKKDLRELKIPIKTLIPIMKLPGILLGIYWKKKYLK